MYLNNLKFLFAVQLAILSSCMATGNDKLKIGFILNEEDVMPQEQEVAFSVEEKEDGEQVFKKPLPLRTRREVKVNNTTPRMNSRPASRANRPHPNNGVRLLSSNIGKKKPHPLDFFSNIKPDKFFSKEPNFLKNILKKEKAGLEVLISLSGFKIKQQKIVFKKLEFKNKK